MKIDIIGDIHGCFSEFENLSRKLGYSWRDGVPIHQEGRLLGFVGDLTDRGPQSLKVIETVWKLWKHHGAYYVPGNHCNKLYRYFLGRNVQVTHGLETTVAELDSLSPKEENHCRRMFMELYEGSPLYQILDEGKLIIAHAGIKEDYIGKVNKSVKTFVLYGDITGEFLPDGRPVRRDWAKKYQGWPFIVYGHTPVSVPRTVGRTINIDTGCVFGGKLTAFRYPEKETVSVPSTMPYIPEKFTEFA
ncbi:bis(5'-nucleosyl)-tetraphosphatase PrpE [Siminovitchia fortis]|uniref:Bis(5'-nucleosyl)-tetraphosphatase PrpE [asymmetrical] n=1 Tax=Siminovitchia fortis TaxID=254758 RepID=A0A443IKJ2_9BACI|nr:bis(5'-nucleosyl)-tetraphosphatase PrpE [Siminovitchia fortis]RWR05550.1 bis(5'-nucleosyl)-tetraphosphatase PrpE [Siminovitchia fortis]WHY83548.1 bis(5'-nucleosyl)-tetraphosphatase PrpE [Siminovitchia fortis]